MKGKKIIRYTKVYSRTDKINVLHVVHPEEEKGRFAYKSVYIDLDNNILLKEGGYEYFPYFVARWDQEKTPYGFPLAGHVLSDIKMLTELKQMFMESARLNVRPPLAVPQQGYLLPMSFESGSINYYQNSISDRIYLINLTNSMPAL